MMRRLVVLLVVCPMLALSFGPQVRNMMLEIASRRDGTDLGPVTEGLVSYWSMRASGGIAFDEIGDNDGSIVEGVAFGTARGVRNDGAEFDGESGFIEINHDLSLDLKTLSVSLWVKRVGDWSQNDMVFGREVSLSPVEIPYRFFFPSAGFSFGTYTDGSATLIVIDTEGITTTTDVWFHYVGTMEEDDGSTHIKLYRDAILIDSTTINTTIPVRSSPLFIGAENNRRFFDGYFDEGRLFNRAITQSEITALYDHDKDGAGH